MRYTKKGLMFLLVMCFMAIAVGFNVKVNAATQTYEECEFGVGTFLITTTYKGDGGDTTHYLPASAASSSPQATTFTNVNEIDDANLWFVTSAPEGKFYIRNAAGSYLYVNKSSTGLRVGGTVDTWTYDSTTNSLKANTNNRYIGVYNAAEWRTYANSADSGYKSSGQSLKFYKVYTTSPTASITNSVSNIMAGAQSTFTVSYENVTNASIAWTTSAAGIATVSNEGVVTGVTMGTVTITATVTGTEGSASASATVNVYPSNVGMITIEQALAIAELTGQSNSPYKYSCTGTVTEKASGNFKITDGNNTITVYVPTTAENGENVTVTGSLINFRGTTKEFNTDTILGYVVSFNSNGGSAVPSQTVTDGEKATEPSPAPTKSGYGFTGWFDGANQWDFENDVVTGNMTLTAKWLNNAVAGIPAQLNNIGAGMDLAYKYNVGLTPTNNANFVRVTNPSQINAGDQVIIVSKIGSEYYALTNTISNDIGAKLAVSISNNEILSSVDSSVVWTLGGDYKGWTLTTQTIVDESPVTKYLGANTGKTNVKLLLSDSSYSFIFKTSGINNYFCVKDASIEKAVICTNDGFKQTSANNIGASGYASELYIFAKRDTVVTYSDVDFRFKMGIDEEINELLEGFEEGEMAIGIEISDGVNTRKYEIGTESHIQVDDEGHIYVIIDLGDVLNNPERLSREFTVRAYAYVEEDYFYSSQEKTYSVYSAVQAYKTQGKAVSGLVTVLEKFGYTFN